MTLISVVIPTYNHAAYVKQAIESVASQTSADIEILIEDDGSIDGTVDAINSLDDSRISFHAKSKNEGACITLNNLIRRSKGKYIALLNSDDIWIPDNKLKTQLDILEDNPSLGASFGRAQFIDHRGEPLDPSENFYGSIFEQENRSQAQWLRRFFLHGNCLCHPTMLIKRECFDKLGFYDNRFRQVPDFHMWIRLIKQYSIHISEDSFIKFRILPGENASASSAANATRLMNEYSLISEIFFDHVDASTLQSGFHDFLTIKNIPTSVHLEIEKALLYLLPGLWLERIYRLTGLRKIFGLLAKPDYREVLASDYAINDIWLHEQMSRYSPFIPERIIERERIEVGHPTTKRSRSFFRYLSFLRKN